MSIEVVDEPHTSEQTTTNTKGGKQKSAKPNKQQKGGAKDKDNEANNKNDVKKENKEAPKKEQHTKKDHNKDHHKKDHKKK